MSEGAREGGSERGKERTLWSLLAVETEQSRAEQSRAEQSAEPGWASGVSGLRGLRGQGLLAVGDIKPSD